FRCWNYFLRLSRFLWVVCGSAWIYEGASNAGIFSWLSDGWIAVRACCRGDDRSHWRKVGDPNRRGPCRGVAVADGADDEAVAIRSAMRDGSAGVRIRGAAGESGADFAMVSCAPRACNGIGVFGTRCGRRGCAEAGELLDTDIRVAACAGDRG